MTRFRPSNPNRGPRRKSARPSRDRTVRCSLRGTIDSLDVSARRFSLRVRSANGGGRGLVGNTVAIDASEADLRIPDGDGDRRATLKDTFPGNEVEVKATRVAGRGLVARVVTHLGPEMPAGGLRRLWV